MHASGDDDDHHDGDHDVDDVHSIRQVNLSGCPVMFALKDPWDKGQNLKPKDSISLIV